MPRVRAPRATLKRRPGAAVVLSVALAAAAITTGCEYVYDDGRPLIATPTPTFTDVRLPRDPRMNEPVTGDELELWVASVLPGTQGQVFHTAFGSMEPRATLTESTGQLPSGTYALTLACRSHYRMNFIVRNGDDELINLSLRCGTARVSVVQLTKDSVLTVEMETVPAANYAYIVSRI
ncbi:hypothetical protein [Arthrobacter rhizosphaerae]|uniref:hypothetical protein n=1 Tax=Arthrobacter rhizosphaerae TaxID=2855490 RepID=UPI001FF4CC3D|nr:hypothetical protein [Arthrobacter rhizosphaerae]